LSSSLSDLKRLVKNSRQRERQKNEDYKAKRRTPEYKQKRLVRLHKPEQVERRKLKRSTEKLKDYMSLYRKTPKYKNYHCARQVEKRKDVKFKMGQALSASIRQCLKLNKAGRHWADLVGWDIPDLIERFEKTKQIDMTLENYGRKSWHWDHIIPQALWQYTNSEDSEFKQCWALCNLQPLWAIDNLKKRDKCI